ncbi:GNAT family N-acetyltransferase [Roseibium sp. RKSG952]|uniref:GNAT family N-acetyltransferase n=1 Tax=Roseibium sp. RKSG952 TaxID=2529384 RepID=UPI0012BCBFEF|nr:GNAT family N-acetyltransferase [Roseibium sp. RKSG952]MTH98192.1 GNAT family N-acetyltransferase [Roseibium sp. RKSG952]
MSTELIDIRPARPADCEALAAIHNAAWLGAYRGLLNGVELQRMISRRGASFWFDALVSGAAIKLLEVAEEPAGYAYYGPCRLNNMAARGEVYELYLRPEYQGLGFGRALFSKVRSELSRRGFEGLAVKVLSDNQPARHFYRALGGQLVARSWYRSAGKRIDLSIYAWPRQ